MDLPSHPEADDSGPDREPAPAGSWAGMAILAVVAALIVVIVVLHLTGVVGPGAN